MGCGASTGKTRRDAEIDSAIMKAHQVEEKKIKLLLLGAGMSGKSTLFKQFRILYGEGFGDKQRKAMVPTIHGNIITAIQTLITHARSSGADFADPDAADSVMELAERTVLTPSTAETIAALWDDAAVRAAYDNRNSFQLADSAQYFLDKVRDAAGPGWVPSVEDVLRSRVRTTGIVTETFIIDGVTFEVYDVGGQRNERKKWINCFTDVDAVIFVAAASEYDQVLEEDEKTNRVDEAVDLWEEIANSKWFAHTPIMLFLNKYDTFIDKLEAGIDIADDGTDSGRPPRFTDYAAGSLSGKDRDSDEYKATLEAAKTYMKGLFLSRTPARTAAHASHPVYTHFSTATDTGNVRFVFEASKEVILASNLRNSGFMGGDDDDDY